MSIQLREYQQQAVDKAVAFLTDSRAGGVIGGAARITTAKV